MIQMYFCEITPNPVNAGEELKISVGVSYCEDLISMPLNYGITASEQQTHHANFEYDTESYNHTRLTDENGVVMLDESGNVLIDG